MRQRIVLIAALLAIVGSGLYLAHRLADGPPPATVSASSSDQTVSSAALAGASQQLLDLVNQEPKIWLVYLLGRIEKIELRLDYLEKSSQDLKEEVRDLRSEVRYNPYWMIGGFAVIIGFLWQTRAR